MKSLLVGQGLFEDQDWEHLEKTSVKKALWSDDVEVFFVSDGTPEKSYFVKTKLAPKEIETAQALAATGYGPEVVAVASDGKSAVLRKVQQTLLADYFANLYQEPAFKEILTGYQFLLQNTAFAFRELPVFALDMSQSENPIIQREGEFLIRIHQQIRAADRAISRYGQRLRDGNAHNFFITREFSGRIQIIDQGERPAREIQFLDQGTTMEYRDWNDNYISLPWTDSESKR